MCLAIPARIIAKDGEAGIAEVSGVTVAISLALLPEAQVDDYVILHVGYALSLVDPDEAERALAALDALPVPALSAEARP
jgi:hydrogenase expression/formation protein HypC